MNFGHGLFFYYVQIIEYFIEWVISIRYPIFENEHQIFESVQFIYYNAGEAFSQFYELIYRWSWTPRFKYRNWSHLNFFKNCGE